MGNTPYKTVILNEDSYKVIKKVLDTLEERGSFSERNSV